jgi:hypothetical protein
MGAKGTVEAKICRAMFLNIAGSGWVMVMWGLSNLKFSLNGGKAISYQLSAIS